MLTHKIIYIHPFKIVFVLCLIYEIQYPQIPRYKNKQTKTLSSILLTHVRDSEYMNNTERQTTVK